MFFYLLDFYRRGSLPVVQQLGTRVLVVTAGLLGYIIGLTMRNDGEVLYQVSISPDGTIVAQYTRRELAVATPAVVPPQGGQPSNFDNQAPGQPPAHGYGQQRSAAGYEQPAHGYGQQYSAASYGQTPPAGYLAQYGDHRHGHNGYNAERK